ncbi:cupin domain-containing protein [Psychrobacter sp. BI730]|uniref:cupin domain-containing protein n=1 Tax=Psychrobacter sp. BI730 TaxID=2705463 RepID=UPI0015C9FCFC|nr:cupin domain-containing protein [Psychrobacter sp. BI730]NYR10142.1 cupin domain-containing protein [Psychrobacter sp. BI730]
MPENHKPSSTTKSKAETAVTDSDNIENDVDSVDDKDADDVDIEIDNIDDDELNDSETDESLKEDIGKKINQLRLAKGYSQRKLAKLSGLTNTSISSIERNKVSPAVNTLKAILTVLGSDLTTFFSDEWKEPKARVIVTPKDLLELNEPHSKVSLKQVYNCSRTRNLGFLIETYQPNSSTEEKIAHEGEEIGTVIEGKIIIRIEDSTYLLNQGDSYVIDTIQPHTFINPTDSITRIVSAHTPTTY